MPWTETSPMDARLIFIAACLRGTDAFSVLCLRQGISRKTGYKWLGRYHEGGVAGIVDRGSAPQTHPRSMDPAIAGAVKALRKQQPTWGPKKLRVVLARDDPATPWPATSTIGDLLHREGLSKPRTPRRKGQVTATPPSVEPTAANESWAADFKGWFRTGDGVRCEPLTVTDGFSRYLLMCEAVPQVTVARVMPVMTRLFQDHGLPRALRTDNGNPFARRDGLGGLSRLSVWLLKLNIWPDPIQPGRPDQNGRHERMHRVLREDAADPPSATLAEQQARLDAWRITYNTVRPHEALGQVCPATLYIPSPRPFPAHIEAWDYPADHQTRRVIGDGHIRWRDGTVYLSGALRGETVGIARRDDGDWAVRFRGFDLTVLTDETGTPRHHRLARTPVYNVT